MVIIGDALMHKESINYIRTTLLVTLIMVVSVLLGMIVVILAFGVPPTFFPYILGLALFASGITSLGFDIGHEPILWAFPFCGTATLIFILDKYEVFVEIAKWLN